MYPAISVTQGLPNVLGQYVTRETTFDVTVSSITEGRLEGKATTTIRYADWDITIPQVPFVASVSDEVRLELDLVATPS